MPFITLGAWFVQGGVTQSIIHVTVWCQVDRAYDVSTRCQVGTFSIMHHAQCWHWQAHHFEVFQKHL
ncbi:hypothetical protein PBY51_012132 [Eleginops maclovinus]|uniref:Uncharacterized protein n=1 Tax=Eleginops maclovinus TaxID=56733 RepID=A0AAN7XQ15_ELEMC|nr:hypothetical protein PBY51_012132 [Eleginops maclovinus]